MAANDLVLLDDVKKMLVIDHDDDDERLGLYISGASGVITNYLKSGAKIYRNEDGNIDIAKVPPEVRSATVALIGIMMREPDGDSNKNFVRQGELPYVVSTLIYQLRDPTIA